MDSAFNVKSATTYGWDFMKKKKDRNHEQYMFRSSEMPYSHVLALKVGKSIFFVNGTF